MPRIGQWIVFLYSVAQFSLQNWATLYCIVRAMRRIGQWIVQFCILFVHFSANCPAFSKQCDVLSNGLYNFAFHTCCILVHIVLHFPSNATHWALDCTSILHRIALSEQCDALSNGFYYCIILPNFATFKVQYCKIAI